MSIYTKTGDSGETGYIGGRISKSSEMMEVIGTLDELNAHIGLAAVVLDDSGGELLSIQSDLFSLGAMIAEPESPKLQKFLTKIRENTKILEASIDAMDKELPMLQSFILPGGSEAAARLHIARTVCRRLERCLVDFADQEEILAYINRLSDYLFTLARYANQLEGVEDVRWTSGY